MKIKTIHPDYPAKFVLSAARWVARQLGMEFESRRNLLVEVCYRKNRHGHGSWGGWCYYWKHHIKVCLPRKPISYPTSMAHNRTEREACAEARDEMELFVAILAHEMEHARSAFAARCKSRVVHKRLNSEPRIRAYEQRVLQEFRKHRDELLPLWFKNVVVSLKLTPDARKAKAKEAKRKRTEKLLATWERKLKLAKTKVAKYRSTLARQNKTDNLAAAARKTPQ